MDQPEPLPRRFMFVDGRGSHVSDIQSFIHKERLRKRTPRSKAPLGWKRQTRVLQPPVEVSTQDTRNQLFVQAEKETSEAPQEPQSLLKAVERQVIHVDPFGTLPIALDHAGQSLFFFSTRHWEADDSTSTYNTPAMVRAWGPQFPYETPIRLSTTLLATSTLLDAMRGRGVSPQTIRWKTAAIQIMNHIVSDPATRYSDEALVGVLTLLLNEILVAGGQKNHIHSRALVQLLRQRLSPECQAIGVNYYVTALSILTSKASVSYLDHLEWAPAAAMDEVRAWKLEVGFTILTLRNLSSLVFQMQKTGRPRSTVAATTCLQLLLGMGEPRDEFESSRQIFVLCYAALFLWEYREAPETYDNYIREAHTRYQKFNNRHGGELPNLFFIFIQGVDSNQDRKWHAVRMTRVIHRVSHETRSMVKTFLARVFGALIGSPLAAELSQSDFSKIIQEALLGLPDELTG